MYYISRILVYVISTVLMAGTLTGSLTGSPFGALSICICVYAQLSVSILDYTQGCILFYIIVNVAFLMEDSRTSPTRVGYVWF